MKLRVWPVDPAFHDAVRDEESSQHELVTAVLLVNGVNWGYVEQLECIRGMARFLERLHALFHWHGPTRGTTREARAVFSLRWGAPPEFAYGTHR